MLEPCAGCKSRSICLHMPGLQWVPAQQPGGSAPQAPQAQQPPDVPLCRAVLLLTLPSCISSPSSPTPPARPPPRHATAGRAQGTYVCKLRRQGEAAVARDAALAWRQLRCGQPLGAGRERFNYNRSRWVRHARLLSSLCIPPPHVRHRTLLQLQAPRSSPRLCTQPPSQRLGVLPTLALSCLPHPCSLQQQKALLS